jgi:hypothetical protein
MLSSQTRQNQFRPFMEKIFWVGHVWQAFHDSCVSTSLHGRYYPKFGPFKQAIIDCLANTSGRHQAKLNTLLTLNVQVFKSAA